MQPTITGMFTKTSLLHLFRLVNSHKLHEHQMREDEFSTRSTVYHLCATTINRQVRYDRAKSTARLGFPDCISRHPGCQLTKCWIMNQIAMPMRIAATYRMPLRAVIAHRARALSTTSRVSEGKRGFLQVRC